MSALPESAPDGDAAPQPGVRVGPDGSTFILRCAPAARVRLLLFTAPDDATPAREIDLERTGDIWRVDVPDAGHGTLYAYLIDRRGASAPAWILDPFTAAVSTPRRWGGKDGLTPGRWPVGGAAFPKGVVIDDARYDWRGDRPPGVPLRDTVIYEAHLRGFTRHPSSGVAQPGTYAAFAEKIPWLKDLGITSVELLPLHEFDEMEFFLENGTRRELRNFWGYSPSAFFAPNARYAAATRPGAAVDELRDLVRALHAEGIEVIFDVVFNHTAETGRFGPALHFKELDPTLYYLHKPGGTEFADFTGCGNTLNANHPAVADMILACLRRWVGTFHADGFRFDLASALTRDPDGRPMTHPPLIEQICADPVLRNLKLIAEPWDAAGLYQVGSFPGRSWLEWNGRFCDDVRRFWGGTGGLLGTLATRVAGHSDLYQRAGRSPLNSVNFITCHDGFTLADLVRYSRRHNEANGEHGADGEKHNHSFNCGVEGSSDDPAVEALRLRQQKNLLATLFLSQGVPMLLAGDEFGRTQRGNNNAYAQDNEISWIDWTLAESQAGLTSFARALIRLRASHQSLRRDRFLTGHGHAGSPPDIRWFGPGGGEPDWRHGAALGLILSGDRRCTGADADEPDLLVLLNGRAETVVFPALPPGKWRLEVASLDPPPEPEAGGVPLSGPSIAIWSGTHASQ